MRPWFTFTIIAIIAGCLLSFWIVVDFVLLNRVMFETPFTITVRLPFTPWMQRWTEVPFMYILTVSVLLGAGIVAVTTLVFDAKRALKVRRMRKELARLQKALEETRSKLPPPPDQAERTESAVAEPEAANGQESPVTEEPVTPITPEDVTHSFEDIVEQGDFVKVAQKQVDEELERHHGKRPEGDIRASVTNSAGEDKGALSQDGDAVQEEALIEQSAASAAAEESAELSHEVEHDGSGVDGDWIAAKSEETDQDEQDAPAGHAEASESSERDSGEPEGLPLLKEKATLPPADASETSAEPESAAGQVAEAVTGSDQPSDSTEETAADAETAAEEKDGSPSSTAAEIDEDAEESAADAEHAAAPVKKSPPEA